MKKLKKGIAGFTPHGIGVGFTLIEFIVVSAVVGTIGLVIVGILTSALRGTKKTNVVNLIRQNGNQALVQMTRTIEYAKGFGGVSIDQKSFSVDCMQVQVAALTPTPVPIRYKYLKITAFDGGEIVYQCGSEFIASNSATIIDSNSVRLVADACWFTCTKERITSNPIIGIKFQLVQKTGTYVESTASIPFETSVTFKNLIK